MKIIQTNNQLEIKTSGVGQLITGVIIGLVGIALIIFVFAGPPDDNGNKIPPWIALIGVAIILGGVGSLFFSKNRRTLIEQDGTTTMTAKRLIGGQPENVSFPTANIVSVRLSTYADNTSNSNTQRRRSVLQLVLNNNDVVDLGGAGGGGFSFNGMNVGSLLSRAPLSKEANQIATFLGIPLDANDSSSIAGAIKSVTSAFQGNKSSNPQQPTPFNPENNQSAAPSQTPPSPQPPQPPTPATTQSPQSSEPTLPPGSNQPQ